MFIKQAPDTLSDDQIQQYLLYLIRERQLSWNSCNVAFNGLHCFFNKFLDSTNRRFVFPPRPRQRKLPEILSRQEVELLINSARNIRHRALLMLTYGSGLRVSEVVNLKPHHIDAERMLVRVEQSKGRKVQFNTVLSIIP
jgi:integrase/recombinase XerD